MERGKPSDRCGPRVFRGDPSGIRTPDPLLKGYTAHRSDGSVVTGIMFEGYPQRLPVYEGVQDAEEKDLLDDAGNRVEGRIVYQRI